MKRKHALKGILFILPSFAGVCVFWLLPYVDVIRRSFLGAVNGVFTGFMNYQMIFSNQAFSSCREKYLAVFRNLYSVTGGLVTGSCCPAKWTWEKSEAADENRIFCFQWPFQLLLWQFYGKYSLMDRGF